ncbi:M20 family metallo-hydrolase [Thermococcus sibiricus]|jgi:succinyl-diaminopimelate desuccinylase|uniref:ArgE/DapE-related deacylase n=1 Tax=Thermococcus sibiricus TaxID=172049 RepID=A0A124FF69_9EURY|nr:M20 family metallo-hydrolase [Thermococcus sibiricus]KUK17171.1 MAG: ArgE/DapE-related deacylase [Thermococcus sibiricus]
MDKINAVCTEVESLRDDMVDALVELIKIPAISPDSGGEGEYDKAMKLLEIIKDWPFDKIERYDAPDPRAKNGIRPNILAYYYGEQGEKSPRLWILTHIDVVPPGDLSKWTVTEPFKPLVKDGKVYGRGSEDNGQSLVASLYAVRALMNLGIRPKRTIVLAFVSDEETGSKYGLEWLMKEHPELFRKDDLVLVPDAGNSDGSFIEIAEKSRLVFKVKTIGKQTHAMSPEKGINAHLVGMRFATALHDMLYAKYSEKNWLFDPPISTFEPTKKEKNVEAVNIIPGEDILYFDCRILPEHDLDDILKTIHDVASVFERVYGAKIEISVLRKFEAPEPTPEDSEVVVLLKRALQLLRGIKPHVGGIGGGTFAAFFRKLGIPSVVWCTCDETAHQPNEYAKIENMVEDAKVFATISLLEEED